MNRKPVKSPIQPTQNPLFLVKLAADLLKVHERFNGGIETLTAHASVIRENAERIKKLPKGDRGERGLKGDPGKDGKDGKDGRDGTDAKIDYDLLREEVVEDVLARIRQPKDGKDAVVDYQAIVAQVSASFAEKLKEMKIADLPHISRELASYRNQLAGKVYGKDTWARGEGDTVSAGSNITLVPQADGTVQINASGGGSGTNVTTQYQLTAVQSGSDVTIDLNQLTNYATFSDLIAVYRNNIMQTEGLNFSVAGDTVTVNNADAAEIFNITYAYA